MVLVLLETGLQASRVGVLTLGISSGGSTSTILFVSLTYSWLFTWGGWVCIDIYQLGEKAVKVATGETTCNSIARPRFEAALPVRGLVAPEENPTA